MPTQSELGWRKLIPSEQNVSGPSNPFPATLDLTPLSRQPTRLPEATVQTVLANPIPRAAQGERRMDGARLSSCRPVSIVVVTHNHLVFTRLCLESVLANTQYPSYEVIVVDNGSTDGTRAYLRSLAGEHLSIRVQFNRHNRGFATASNQGLALGTGEVLVLLNNDTIVPRAWLARLVRHLEEPAIGLAGPVSSFAGNEARIQVPYRTYGEFEDFAQHHMQAHEGKAFDIPTLEMFCLAMRREVYEALGPLDERFEVGLFEDDDYALRARQAGWRVVCVQDVFVHHFGQVSFGQLPSGEYMRLFEANRARFEAKWGIAWETHKRPLRPHYQQLVDRIRTIAPAVLPAGARVLIASRGDRRLLELPGVEAQHFPQGADGGYAGYYPRDDAEAVAHLQSLHAKGADFLLFPSTAYWWLEHYGQFRRHLEGTGNIVFHEPDTCLIFRLGSPDARGAAP